MTHENFSQTRFSASAVRTMRPQPDPASAKAISVPVCGSKSGERCKPLMLKELERGEIRGEIRKAWAGLTRIVSHLS
jgi:hypothetical protein